MNGERFETDGVEVGRLARVDLDHVESPSSLGFRHLPVAFLGAEVL